MDDRRALALGFLAYILWGLFPLYFRLLDDSGPLEVIAYRAIWALVFCALILTVTRAWVSLTAVLRQPRTVATLAIAGLLVALNWGIYVWGVTNGRALDTSMGYFMNPLVSALLGVIVLGERLRRAQWVAFGFGALAVIVLIVGYGEFPWVAVTLATSFGLYGLAKKRVGGRVGAVAGFTTETLALTPLALGYLAWLHATGAATVAPVGAHGAFVALSGPITAIPLLLFAYAAARLNLSTIGMLQYIAPLMIFLIGWLAFREPMPAERWAGFALIWVAVIVFAVDAARASRTPRLRHRPERPA